MPHLGTSDKANSLKRCFLGYMCNLVIKCYLGKRGFDDRDHWGSKRLQLTGSLLHDLFRRCFNDFTGTFAKLLSKKQIDIDFEH